MTSMTNDFVSEDLVLVTGASSGIGASVVENLLLSGVRVARREDKLNDIATKSKNFFYEVFDVRCIENIADLVKVMVTKYGKFSGFVHCAGVLNPQPLALWDYKNAIDDFKCNVFSAIEFIKALSKKKNKQELLSCVLISSIAASIGNAGSLTYAMTKISINNIVVTLSQELANQKIRINAVAPGGCVTEMAAKYQSYIMSYDYLERVRSKNLFHEDGKPSYIADLVAFLLSKKSYWIQGQVITIDGGETLG